MNNENKTDPFAGLFHKDAAPLKAAAPPAIPPAETNPLKAALANVTSGAPLKPSPNPFAPAPLDPSTPPENTLLESMDTADMSLSDLSKYQFESQPDDFSEDQVERFRGFLTRLQASFRTNDCHDNLVQTMAYLKSHPDLKKLLKDEPEHMHIMVNALQLAYGTAIQKRTTNTAAKGKRAQKAAKAEQFMADMMGNVTF